MQERRKAAVQLLGKTVHVEIDRPIGYDHDGTVYPINYGYIPGMIAGDGEEQDAYILGVSEPLTSFEGCVVGAVLRKNDVEDKLIVAPWGLEFHQAQIAHATYFQEQYFDIAIVSAYEKSCGVLPFRMVNGEKEFLLVFEAYSQCWSLPKGHMEAGETQQQTALRELFEETGLTARLIPNRVTTITYPVSPSVRKEVVFFLGEVEGIPKTRAGEIEGYKWVCAERLPEYLFPDTVQACYTLLK